MKNYESEEFKDDFERLKQENEIKKLKLELEFRANFPNESENEDLPLEVERQFLDKVSDYENAFKNSERISLYDFIGKPEYKETAVIPDSEISAELDQITQLLNENQIALNTLCEVNDRVLYQFITEELFFTETDNMKIDGWISYFTYEDFHPNHEYDLRNNCTDFFKSFLNKESEYYTSHLSKEAEKNTWFENFRKAFKSFSIRNFEIKTIQINELVAKVKYEISFSGIIEGSNETEYFSGFGELKFLHQWGYWYIQELTMPFNQN